MEFRAYQHIERFGTSEVEGIEFGEVYVFPKIDGTNASAWLSDDGTVEAGSRKRHLTEEDDNAGFREWAVNNSALAMYFEQHPDHRLFGEWLVPHSLRTYREEAWRKFYVFDVVSSSGEYIHYEDYSDHLQALGIDYIPPICTFNNTTYERLVKELANNVFLIEDGKGAGEGIVIKRYGYLNKYGRTTWAKIVTSEFKEKHAKVMGAPSKSAKKMVEETIANKYVTKALCEKVKAKIELDEDGFRSKDIPRLLNTVFHDLVAEESWNFVKEHRRPTINYSTLQHFAFRRVKECLPMLF